VYVCSFGRRYRKFAVAVLFCSNQLCISRRVARGWGVLGIVLRPWVPGSWLLVSWLGWLPGWVAGLAAAGDSLGKAKALGALVYGLQQAAPQFVV